VNPKGLSTTCAPSIRGGGGRSDVLHPSQLVKHVSDVCRDLRPGDVELAGDGGGGVVELWAAVSVLSRSWFGSIVARPADIFSAFGRLGIACDTDPRAVGHVDAWLSPSGRASATRPTRIRRPGVGGQSRRS
jgi:hypothetical protein